jgi:hypothetical protein
MPSKVDKLSINNEKLDKRVKLTQADKEAIIKEYASGTISITSLGKKYKVSKRLIQFTLFPERKELAKKLFLERQKDGRYYDKDKNTEQMRVHRAYKRELYEKCLLSDKPK